MDFLIFLFLIKLTTSRPRGYLYSHISNQFVCNQNDVMNHINQPLLFDLNKISGNVFQVLRMGVVRTNKYKIEISSKGEARIIKCKGSCGVLRHGKMIFEPCTQSIYQRYIWVPEHLLHDFSNKFSENRDGKIKQNFSENRDELVDKNLIGDSKVRQRFEVIEDAKRVIKAAKEIIKNRVLGEKTDDIIRDMCKDGFENKEQLKKCDGLYNRHNGGFNQKSKNYSGYDYMSQSEMIDRGSNYKKNEIPVKSRLPYNRYFNNSCKQDNQDALSGDMAQYNNQGVRSPPKMGPYITNTQDEQRHMLTNNLDQPNESIPDLSKCTCHKECVRNPQNNICYYKMDANGKLMPILRDISCCNEEKTDVCNKGDQIEQWLCKLSFRSHYGFIE